MYKNIGKKTKLNLKDLVDYQDGQVVSMRIDLIYILVYNIFNLILEGGTK